MTRTEALKELLSFEVQFHRRRQIASRSAGEMTATELEEVHTDYALSMGYPLLLALAAGATDDEIERAAEDLGTPFSFDEAVESVRMMLRP